jgi:hypothetical protein
MLSDSDTLLICSLYVVRFDAPFIWCWMIQTLCSFIAHMCSVSILMFVWYWLSWTPCSFAGCMCFVSDLALFDTDHILCYRSTGCKCFLFQCFLYRIVPIQSVYCRVKRLTWRWIRLLGSCGRYIQFILSQIGNCYCRWSLHKPISRSWVLSRKPCGIWKFTLHNTFLDWSQVQNILLWVPEWDGTVPIPDRNLHEAVNKFFLWLFLTA